MQGLSPSLRQIHIRMSAVNARGEGPPSNRATHSIQSLDNERQATTLSPLRLLRQRLFAVYTSAKPKHTRFSGTHTGCARASQCGKQYRKSTVGFVSVIQGNLQHVTLPSGERLSVVCKTADRDLPLHWYYGNGTRIDPYSYKTHR